MSYIERSEVIDVDSDQRTNLSDTTDNFSQKFNVISNKGYNMICVLSATVKKAWELIRSPNNTFVLVENGVQTVITLDEGNMSAYSFCDIVAAKLNAASVTMGNNWVYTITLPDPSVTTGRARFTYTVANNGSSQPSFIFSNGLTYQFGFSLTRHDNPTTTATFVNNTITSTNSIDFQLDNTIFICSDIASSSGRANGRIQGISSAGNADYSCITYRCPDVQAYSIPFNNMGTDTYRFYLCNHDNKPVFMNGIDWMCEVLVYKKK